MAILLTIEESENQIVSGFPEYVILSTNISSTIFYTLDETDPTEDSEIFVDRIVLPTNGLALTLRAMAISGLEISNIIEQVYFIDQSALNRTRLLAEEGIRVLPFGEEVVDSRAFNQDGDPAQETVIDFNDLDLKASTVNRFGESIPGRTTIDFINFEIEQALPQETVVSYLNETDNFDPKAMYIIMDGTSQDNIDSQAVRIINRPYGSMDLKSPIHANEPNNFQLTSANLVRYMVNPRNGVMTFYYRDSRENRWIKSTQHIEGRGLNISPKDAGPPSSFVFRWIEDRGLSKIF